MCGDARTSQPPNARRFAPTRARRRLRVKPPRALTLTRASPLFDRTLLRPRSSPSPSRPVAQARPPPHGPHGISRPRRRAEAHQPPEPAPGEQRPGPQRHARAPRIAHVEHRASPGPASRGSRVRERPRAPPGSGSPHGRRRRVGPPTRRSIRRRMGAAPFSPRPPRRAVPPPPPPPPSPSPSRLSSLPTDRPSITGGGLKGLSRIEDEPLRISP